MMSQIRSFFGYKRQYAVVGATKNTSKFGFKILMWYINHDLPVVPINPKEEEICGEVVVNSVKPLVLALVENLDLPGHQLSAADGLSILFLTPPRITRQTLDDISSVPGFKTVIKGLWFQPGSYDQAVLDKAEEIGLSDRAIHEDECILVRGEAGLSSANL